VIERNVSRNLDRHGLLRAFAGERTAGETRVAVLDSLINGRVN
jgi:hypothetical protein